MKARDFFFPSLTPKFLARLVLVAACAYGVFGYLLLPLRISGRSMEPTYHTNRVNFCWRLRYAFSEPRRSDVVIVRFAGKRVMLLKRVVAMAGETVEFRSGTLFVNGSAMSEPYVKYPCNWNLEPRTVGKGCVYVIGDNRSVPIEEAVFGEAQLKRIMGGTLW